MSFKKTKVKSLSGKKGKLAQFFSKEGAITLVALVITIVVLLILAGVTIAGVLGDNGIIRKALKAKEQIEIAGTKEEIELAYAEANMYGKDILSKTKEILDKTNKTETVILGETLVVIYKETGAVYEIVNNKVEYIGIRQITSNQEPIMTTRTIHEQVLGTDTAFWVENIRTKITKIETKNYIVIPDNTIKSWDISKEQNNSVLAWIVDDGNEGYKLTIAADGSIIVDSGWCLFDGFTMVKEIDLSAFDTSRTTTLQAFCRNCKELEYINISSFDTKLVKDMSSLFDRCRQLKEVNLTNFNTSEVTTMKAMFRECETIKKLNLSSFNMNKVNNVEAMFAWCSNLATIYVKENWDNKTTIVNYNSLFAYDFKLKGTKSYATENIQGISMANYENGYFTYKD